MNARTTPSSVRHSSLFSTSIISRFVVKLSYNLGTNAPLTISVRIGNQGVSVFNSFKGYTRKQKKT